jgi:hypothetical protein
MEVLKPDRDKRGNASRLIAEVPREAIPGSREFDLVGVGRTSRLLSEPESARKTRVGRTNESMRFAPRSLATLVGAGSRLQGSRQRRGRLSMREGGPSLEACRRFRSVLSFEPAHCTDRIHQAKLGQAHG